MDQTIDHSQLWSRTTSVLRKAMDDATFDLWIAPLRSLSCDQGTLCVGAPESIRPRVESRLLPVIVRAARTATEQEWVVRIEALPTEAAPRPGPPANRRDPASAPTDDPVPHDPGPGLNPKFTFEQFVIGDANRFAHAAALAAAELPGQAYNPLFLYGPPGVGKSHLLHAIGNYVTAHEPTMSVRYATAEHFTNDFLGCLKDGGVSRFKSRYRRVDLLLVDDVQFLERKARTEEEFFHTFNALRDAGAQVVLTSDRLPRDMDDLELRLRERFEAGLVADIAPPDPAMRIAVLRKRAALDDLRITDGALHLIAERVPTNVRALEAALIRTVAFSSLTGRPLDEALARRVLDDLYPERVVAGQRPLSVEDVIQLVAETFSITPEELCSSSREARIAWPRSLAMYLSREHTDQSLPAIARAFGARAHTTVLHACRRTSTRLQDDIDANDIALQLSRRLAARDADRRG